MGTPESEGNSLQIRSLFGEITFEVKDGQIVETHDRKTAYASDSVKDDLIQKHILKNSNGLFDVVRATLTSTADALWNVAKQKYNSKDSAEDIQSDMVRTDFSDEAYIQYIAKLKDIINEFNKNLLDQLSSAYQAGEQINIVQFQKTYNDAIEALTPNFAQEIYIKCAQHLYGNSVNHEDIKAMLKDNVLAAKQHTLIVTETNGTETVTTPADHGNKGWKKLESRDFSPITTTTTDHGIHFRMPTTMGTEGFDSLYKQLIQKANDAILLKRHATMVTEDEYSLYSDRLTSIQNRLTNPVDIKDQLKDQQVKRLKDELRSIHKIHRAACEKKHPHFIKKSDEEFTKTNRKRLPVYFRSLNVNQWGQDLSYPTDPLTYLAQIHNNLSMLNLLHDMNENNNEDNTAIVNCNQEAHLAYSHVILAYENVHQIPIDKLQKLANKLTSLREQAAELAIKAVENGARGQDQEQGEVEETQRAQRENSLKLMLYRQLTQKNNAYISKQNIWLTAALAPIFMGVYASGCKSAMDRYNIVRSYTQFLELLCQLSNEDISQHDARDQILECITALTGFIQESNQEAPDEAKLDRLAEDFSKEVSQCVKLITGCQSYADHEDGTGVRKLAQGSPLNKQFNTNHAIPNDHRPLSVENSTRKKTTAVKQCKRATSNSRSDVTQIAATPATAYDNSLHAPLLSGNPQSDSDGTHLPAADLSSVDAASKALNKALAESHINPKDSSTSKSSIGLKQPVKDLMYFAWHLVPLFAPVDRLWRKQKGTTDIALAYYNFLVANSLYAAIQTHTTSVSTVIFGSTASNNAIHLSHMLHLTHGHAHAALITCTFPAVMVAGGIMAFAAGCYCAKQVGTSMQSGHTVKAALWSAGAGVSFSAFALSVCAMTVGVATATAATTFLWPVALAAVSVAAGLFIYHQCKTTPDKNRLLDILSPLKLDEDTKKLIVKHSALTDDKLTDIKAIINAKQNGDTLTEGQIKTIVDSILPDPPKESSVARSWSRFFQNGASHLISRQPMVEQKHKTTLITAIQELSATSARPVSPQRCNTLITR